MPWTLGRLTKQRQRVGAAAYFYWRMIICQTAYTSTPPKQGHRVSKITLNIK
ncbi:hypothetical protein ACVWVY_001788 [Bradyrhizobium sp. URHC0002]